MTSCLIPLDKFRGMTFKFSSRPEDGNWLYTPGPRYAVLRAYQADPSRIGDYVPPAFTTR